MCSSKEYSGSATVTLVNDGPRKRTSKGNNNKNKNTTKDKKE